MKDILTTPIQYIKGVGPKTGKHLENLDIRTLKDLFYFFPRTYEDRRKVPAISEARANESMFFVGKVVTVKAEVTRNRMKLFKARIADGSGSLTAVWFNQPFLGTTIKPGRDIFVTGKVEFNRFQGEVQLLCSDYELLDVRQEGTCPVTGRVIPVYALTRGVTQKKLRTMLFEALNQHLGKMTDYFSSSFRSTHRLVGIRDAIMQLHFPRDRESYRQARRRIVFDEFFFIQLVLAQKRYRHRSIEQGISFRTDSALYGQYLERLPFTLTSAQQRVIADIMHDMARPVPMNRLVQGDVGAGKTEVAVAAIVTAVDNGYQAALMAPTEILAEQHYKKLVRHLEPLGIRVELLTGRVRTKQKQSVKEYLQSNLTHVVVGTHALIQESVSIPNLGLAVVDEQHRFGVLQRAALKRHGRNPDLLVMTATPIPRTLSLTLYGDLDKSVIDELPPGRKPIKTLWCKRATETYEFLREKLRAGEQVYYVLPLVEESEKLDLKAAVDMYEHLRTSVFPEIQVGLIHGKMKGDDKDQVMLAFREKRIQLLVATTVIEVGIDVPNASVMIIEHAERFGLSQLHQLRGRVGRGTLESFCILIGNPKSADGKKRLKVMTETTDGFRIAECDLEIRGSGDYYGIRQSGLPSLRFANLIKDEPLLLAARRAAEEVIEQDVDLAHEANRGMKVELENRQEYTVTHHGMN